MPWNIWLSEGAVQISLVTMLSAYYQTYRSHGWVQHCRRSDDPIQWAWVARWERVFQLNTAWLFFSILLFVFQVRVHLFQIGLMPMPFK